MHENQLSERDHIYNFFPVRACSLFIRTLYRDGVSNIRPQITLQLWTYMYFSCTSCALWMFNFLLVDSAGIQFVLVLLRHQIYLNICET